MCLYLIVTYGCCCLSYLEGPRFENRGMFKLGDDKNHTISFYLYPNATISWINGKPPVDAPKCGFENEKCIEEEEERKLCKLHTEN